jgi:NAD+ synthetase
MNSEKITQNIRENLGNYITTNGIKSLVIGVSGGIDSTLCCALAYPVCQQFNVPLIGISIPIESNKPDEIKRAKEVGEAFCDKFMEVDLTSLYERERDFLWSRIGTWAMNNFTMKNGDTIIGHDLTDTQVKIANGNLKARERMRLLYFTAGITGGMVLSTDNKTELCVGYFTLHGDVGDYGMIQNLWKTEVYELADFLRIHYSLHNLNRAGVLVDGIKATPTDGLGITNSDLDQLGAPTYADVDRILQTWLTPVDPEEALAIKDHPVIQRHIKSEFKRNNPYNIPREELFKGAQLD